MQRDRTSLYFNTVFDFFFHWNHRKNILRFGSHKKKKLNKIWLNVCITFPYFSLKLKSCSTSKQNSTWIVLAMTVMNCVYLLRKTIFLYVFILRVAVCLNVSPRYMCGPCLRVHLSSCFKQRSVAGLSPYIIDAVLYRIALCARIWHKCKK